jgi:hypothetical protein
MVGARESLVTIGAVATVILFSSAGGCGGQSGSPFGSGGIASSGESSGTGGGDQGSGAGGSGGSSGDQVFSSSGSTTADAGSCSGLGCDVKAGCTTSLTGTVYDPAGANPLYNVVVYIPSDPQGALTLIKEGTNTCNTCEVAIGDYVTATTSDANGNFTLTDVPAATHVPLVVQIGKWRREVFLPEVKACTTTAIPGSSSTRLPAKQSEGDIPQMALVTGGADNLGCFLKGIGLDPSEYSAPHAGGRLDIYQGLPVGGGGRRSGAPGLSTGTAGDCTSDNQACVWHSKANFEAYDMVLLACEGNPYDPDDPDTSTPTNKTASSKQALHDWLDEGGKVFSTHFHYTWFKNSPAPEFKTVATWLGASGGDQSGLYDIDTTFTKAKVFNQWLSNVRALTGTQISLSSVAESVSTISTSSQRWIYDPASEQGGVTNSVKYMSFQTPIGGAAPASGSAEGETQYCGKAVFSDLHAGGSPAGAIPDACAGPPLSAQLKALEFLFFDLSACVSNDSLPPPNLPPPTK